VTSDVSQIKAAGHGRATKGARAKGSKGKTGVAAGQQRSASGGAAVQGARVSANQ